MTNDIPVRVYRVITKCSGIDRLSPSTKLADVLDSVEFWDLVMELEGEFGITISDDDTEHMGSVAEVVSLVAGKVQVAA